MPPVISKLTVISLIPGRSPCVTLIILLLLLFVLFVFINVVLSLLFVCVGGRILFLHVGQDAFTRNHSSTHWEDKEKKENWKKKNRKMLE